VEDKCCFYSLPERRSSSAYVFIISLKRCSPIWLLKFSASRPASCVKRPAASRAGFASFRRRSAADPTRSHPSANVRAFCCLAPAAASAEPKVSCHKSLAISPAVLSLDDESSLDAPEALSCTSLSGHGHSFGSTIADAFVKKERPPPFFAFAVTTVICVSSRISLIGSGTSFFSSAVLSGFSSFLSILVSNSIN